MATQDGVVELKLTAKNLTSEAFGKVSEALRKLEDDAERVPRKGQQSWAKWFATISGGVAVGGLIKDAFSAAGSVLASIPGHLIELGQRGSEVANVSRSFDALTRSVGQSGAEMLKTTQTATKGLIADMDIMAATNKGLLLGLPLTAQEMGTLSKTAVVLGGAMRVGPNQALSDLITGLGRGSAAILDNLGITVKAEDAYAKYAAKVGKSASELTEAEKKTAIYTAAIGAAREATEKIGDVQLTFAERIEQAKTLWTNFTDNLGVAIATSPAVNAAFDSIAEAITGAFGTDKQQQIETLTGYVNTAAITVGKMGVIALDVAKYTSQAWDVVKTTFYATATVLGGAVTLVGGFLGGLAEMATKLPFVGDQFEGLADRIHAFNTKTWESTKGFAQLTTESAKGVTGQGAYYDALEKTRGALSGVVDKMTIAAAATRTTAEASDQHAGATRKQGEEATQTSEKVLKLQKSLGELSREIDAAIARGMESGEILRLFGDKALKAADDAKRAGVQISGSLEMVATAARQLDNAQFLQKVAIQTTETGRKIYEELVARLAKQQDAELKHVAELLQANRQYQDDLALLGKTGTDRQIAEIERARQAEIDALPQRTAVTAAFYDERLRQINAYYDHEIRVATGAFDTIADRMRELGIVTRRELQESAAAATRDYQQMKESGLYTADQIEQAWVRMMQANAEALGGWRGAFIDVVSQFPSRLGSTLGEMLTLQTGWREGGRKILEGFRDDFVDILEQMVRQWVQSFIGRLLSSLLGARPQFASAWSAILPGAGMGGGGGMGIPGVPGIPGIPGLPGWLGGAANGGGIPGVTGTYTVGNLPGAAGATPWWSTGLGGGALGAGAGALAGWMLGAQTGNVAGSAAGGAGTGALVGGLLGGPLGLGIGLIGGGLVGWYRAKQENIKTNDLRDVEMAKTAERFGLTGTAGTGVGSTYHNIAAQLTAAGHGEGGGELFRQLVTQNDRDGFRKALEAVNKALAEYEQRTKAATAAEEQNAAAIAATTEQHKERIASLQEELAGVFDQEARLNAQEAPEEHMGYIERAQREHIAKEKARIQAAIDEQNRLMEAALSDMETTAEQTASSIGTAFEEQFELSEQAALDFAAFLRQMGREGKFDTEGRIHLKPDYEALDRGPYQDDFTYRDPRIEPIPMAAGGYGKVTGRTLFLAGEQGPEEFAFSGANRTFGDVMPRPTSLVIHEHHYHAPILDGASWRQFANDFIWADQPRALKDNVAGIREATARVALEAARR